MTLEDVESTYNVPVCCELYAGLIIETGEPKCSIYAEAGETFSSISKRLRCGEEKLRELNGGVIYPTKRIWIP